ncbi:MAG: hypothetical protein AAGA31_15960, partial [Bacteroidota bacterium]
ELNTITATKLITRHGILEEVEVTNNGSSLPTINHTWDALTGSPILTSTENEYDQPIYTQTLPAYWMIPQAGMGPAYENQGAIVEQVMVENGRVVGTNATMEELFRPGDEVLCFEPGQPASSDKAARLFAVPFQGNMQLVDEQGMLANTPMPGGSTGFTLKVIRSGRRNILAANSGQTNSLTKPAAAPYWSTSESDATLLNSSATTFSDNWGDQCTALSAAPPPCPEYETLKQSIDDYEILVYLDANDNCFIEGEAWDTQLAALQSCELCEYLFWKYANHYFLDNMDSYGDCTDDGFVLSTDPAVRNQIRACQFITEAANTHLRGVDVALTGLDNSMCPQAGTCEEIEIGPIIGGPYVPPNTDPNNPLTLEVGCFPWYPMADINPYLDGRRGNWRLEASYVAEQAERNQALAGVIEPDPDPNDELDVNVSQQPLLYQAGTFDDYLPFWSQGQIHNGGASHQIVSIVEHYDDHGHAVETEAVIGNTETDEPIVIPSASQYGFAQSLPTAVAQNARRTDIGFESFEDYQYDRGVSPEYWQRQFGLAGSTVEPGSVDDNLATEAAHTGLYAYKVSNGGGNLITTFPVYESDAAGLECPEGDGCNEPMDFAPAKGQRYLYSAWIASNTSLSSGLHPAQPFELDQAQDDGNSVYLKISYTINGVLVAATPSISFPSGPIVEGWQQINQEFTVPIDATEVRFELSAPLHTECCTPPPNVVCCHDFYFDDIRVQPYEANMMNYVYHPESLLLMAELDDRGYATLYEYDDERRLIRRKKETERGIMTVTEQHQNLSTED